jgi:hypothetical protein
MGCIDGNRIFRGMQGIILIAIIALSWGFSFGSELSAKENNDNHFSDKKAVSDQAMGEKNHKVIVFYFHGTVRCRTCNLIEKLTKEAVKEGFGDEVKKGLIEIKVVNVQDPKNNRYITSYRLYTKTVIVSDTIGGKEQRWKNLQRIWELTYNDTAFKEYIQKEVREYLKGKRS